MARGKKKETTLTQEEKLAQALVPVEEQSYPLPVNWCWIRQSAICGLSDGEKCSGKSFPYWEVKTLRGLKEIQYATDGKFVSKGTKVILVDGENSGEVFDIPDDGFMGSTFKSLSISASVNWDYLRFFIATQKELYRNNKKGSAIPHLNKDLFFNMPLPFAPFAEQQRIVDRIERLFAKLDEAYEKAQEVVDNFGTRKLSMLSKAFSGDYTVEWRRSHAPTPVGAADACRHTAQQWTKKEQRLLAAEQDKICFEAKENGHMWMICTIGAVARISNGSTPSRAVDAYWNGDIPWVSSGEVKNNIICETAEKITQAGFENTSVKLLPVGTVLIAMIGEGKTRGQSAILQIPATTNQNVAAIIIDLHHVDSKYLWYWLQMNYAKNREIGGGSGPQALNCQRVRELDFKLPTIAEQAEIVRILDSLLAKEQQAKETAETVLEKIDLLKKAILARAFRSELGTNDPTEESAQELLKAIL